MSVNKVILVGRITADIEVKDAGSSKLAKFSIATNERYTKKDGTKVENTEFHNIVVWGKPAEIIAQYKKKGDEIYIEGKLETSNWEDKDSGKKMYRTEVKASSFEFIGGQAKPATGNGGDDELPF
jgi:single-strand DNA-binding protein